MSIIIWLISIITIYKSTIESQLREIETQLLWDERNTVTGIFPQGALNIIVTDEGPDSPPDNGLLLSDSSQCIKEKQEIRPFIL